MARKPKFRINDPENPQISLRVSPYLFVLCKDAAESDDRDLAPWVRIALEKAAKLQLKKRGK